MWHAISGGTRGVREGETHFFGGEGGEGEYPTVGGGFEFFLHEGMASPIPLSLPA